MRIVLFVIAIFLILFIVGCRKNEPFMDEPLYQHVRYELLKSEPSLINKYYNKCIQYCKNLKHKINCEILCDQYAEDKSDNYKYQTHIFGSAIDKFKYPK